MLIPKYESYELTKMEIFDMWCDFLKEQNATTKVNLLRVLDTNYNYAVSRQKKIYPFLPLKGQRYRKTDVLNWFWDLLIFLHENGQLKVKAL